MFLKKINQYVLGNILYFTVFYTIIPTIILWLVQSRNIFELALGSQASALVILKMSLYLIPPILPHILPFAVLLAGITVLVRFYYDSELVVLWASGMRPHNFMKNFMMIAFMAMVLILLINAFIAPYMSRQLKIEFLNLKNDIIQTALKPSTLQDFPERNITLHIDKISGNSLIEGFFLQQKIDYNHVRIFTAKQGLLTENSKKHTGDFKILLLNGRIINWQHGVATKPNQTILEFDKFTLNITDILNNFNNSQDLQFKSRDYSIQDLLAAKYAKTPQEAIDFIASGHGQIIASFFPVIFMSFVIVFMLRPMPPRGFKYDLILKTIFCAVAFRIFSAALYNFADGDLNLIHVSYAIHIVTVFGIHFYYIRLRK